MLRSKRTSLTRSPFGPCKLLERHKMFLEEKVPVVIKRHGRPAAILHPITKSTPKNWYGRARKTTKINHLKSAGQRAS